jgi:hypothetical protein
MAIAECESWEDFLDRLREVRESETRAGHEVKFLFRGIGDSTWTLNTTLERAGRQNERILAYMEWILRIHPQIESFTGRKWDVPSFPEVETLLLSAAPTLHNFPGKEYSYIVYLRHHGFPSPLLDWTRSEYVAAFFAFRAPVKPMKDKVSIFVFSEKPRGFKSSSLGEPYIQRVGPYVVTHKRHFLQQSDYTLCMNSAGGWHFASLGSVFERRESHQDALWKFNLPWSERGKILKILDAYNLNAFSLFDTDETLMETIATRELAAK